ncbi:gamma-parvin isoform X2 [Narcine bancroftii]|uniref:gamma-parvin isoform X2 n=1 Tax=Narcine bancroftii TaxID=1343680 RepID=UPI003831AFC5
MDSSFSNLIAGFEEFKESTKIEIPLGEKRKFIQPSSLKSPKLEELMTFFIDWINATLKQDHVVVQSLEEDLYDGLVLHLLLEHLTKVKLDVEEIALSTSVQKQKLRVVLDRVNQFLQVTEDDHLNWNVDLIHNKDLVATLHLLVAISKHFRPDVTLPENVYLETLILEIDKTGIKTTKHLEYITEKRDDEEQNQTPEADQINDLFKLGPDKVRVVQQFSNGVILILLIGQLEDYFIHLSEYYLNPSDVKEKLHNVSYVLELLEDRGLLTYPINPQETLHSLMSFSSTSMYFVDFRRKSREYDPILIKDSIVESVKNFRFLVSTSLRICPGASMLIQLQRRLASGYTL